MSDVENPYRSPPGPAPEVVPAADDIVVAQRVDERPPPWGFWPTLGFSCVVIATLVIVQTMVMVGFLVVHGVRDGGMRVEDAVALESNGLFVALATCGSAAVCLTWTWLFAWLRWPAAVPEYLGIRRVSWRTFCGWLAVFLVFLAGSEGLTQWLERPVPTFMIDAYRTAGFLPLLWLAIILVAPLFEELFFRGFMLRGLQRSFVGGAGAILITSLVWAAIHLQYDAYNVATIFVVGLMLGVVRLRTGSVVPPILLHATMNLLATVQIAIYLGWQD